MAIKKAARCAVVVAAAMFASAAFAPKEIRGTGATFPSIIYSTWAIG